MNKFGSLFGAAILVLASMPVNAALMYETYEGPSGFGEWRADVAKLKLKHETETFPGADIVNPLTIIFDYSEITSTATNATNINRVQGGEYQGIVGGTAGRTTITWEFPYPVLGFYGIFSKLGEGGSVLDVMVRDAKFGLTDNGGFGILGRSSADLFSKVAWSSNGSQSFIIDDFSYTAATDSTPVPAPPALWLFGAGLLGLIGFSRRRKAA